MIHKKIIEAKRNTDDTYEVIMEDRKIENFLCFRGSVVWPHNLQPGLILLAGEMRVRLVPKIDQIIICEAQEFNTINEAANIFIEFWNRYQPHGYFHQYIPFKRGRHDIIIGGFGIPHHKSIMVFRNEYDIFHPGCLQITYPLSSIEQYRVKFFVQFVIFLKRHLPTS